MKSFFYGLNWILHYFSRIAWYIIAVCFKLILGFVLFFAAALFPSLFLWESETLDILWGVTLFFLTIFGSIFYLIYREQEEVTEIEDEDGTTYIAKPALPPQKERIYQALKQSLYWFGFAVVIILYSVFLIGR